MSNTMIAADTTTLNAQAFYDQLDRLMGACIGVIAVRTREMNRGKLLMHQWASMRGLEFNVWDAIEGFQTYRSLPVMDGANGNAEVVVEDGDMNQYMNPNGKVTGTGDILAALAHYKKRDVDRTTESNKFCGVFLGVIEDWLKEPMVQEELRKHVQRAYQNDDRIILFLTPGTAIPDAIAGDIEVIDMATPSYAELMDALKEMEAQIPEEFNYEMDDEDRQVIVQNGIGMTQQEFDNAMSLAIVDISSAIERDDSTEVTAQSFVNVVRTRKLEVLKQTKILELMRPASLSDVGGLDLLKEDLELRKKAFSPEAHEFGIRAPKGFLVVGPPGTGKTLVAEATAAALGVAGIKFDMSAVLNALVGSSEQRMRACLKMAEEMAPCVLFIDEVDKAIGNGGSGDNTGVMQRIFGTLLTWMQDKSNKNIPVLVVASANNITHIPPEFLRKGRFDNIWAVSFPSVPERAQIFKIHVEKRGHELKEADYIKLAKASEKFVGAEIEAVVEEALLLDFDAGNDGVQVETILGRIDALTPQANIFPEKIEAMHRWCKNNAKAASRTAQFVDEPQEKTKTGTDKPMIRRKPRLARRSSNN